jgi:hypothetical protein
MRRDSTARKLGVRLLILGVVAIGPVGGALTGTDPGPLAVLVGGALLIGVVIERELDRAVPLGSTRCGFCSRPRDQVTRLVAGEHGAAICEDCVALCDRLLHPVVPPGPGAPVGADPWRPPER